MKCSRFRKRYIAIGYTDQEQVKKLSYDMKRIFGSRQKFSDGQKIIVLTDQFVKDRLCNYVTTRQNNFRILGVSGTIKGCKSQAKLYGEEDLHIS